MAAKGARNKITLACTECKQRNYDTFKNKKNDPERIEMEKFKEKSDLKEIGIKQIESLEFVSLQFLLLFQLMHSYLFHN